MKKLCLTLFAGSLACAVLYGAQTGSALAIKPFETEFKAVYYKPDGSPAEKALAGAIDGAKCNVCHMGTSKKMRNAYGEALDKLLDKMADKDKPDVIKKALETVAAQKTGADASAPTFGDLLKAGKLPGGE